MNVNLYAILKDDSVKFMSLSSDIQNEIVGFVEIKTNILKKEIVEFDGQYIPENEEILEIKNFELPFDVDFDNPLNLEQVTMSDIDSIKSVVINMPDAIGFQCFDGRKVIEPSKLNLLLRQNTFSKVEDKGVTIDERLDVIYRKSDKSLLFQSYHNAKKIFDLSNYYREATENEINDFFESSVFSDIPDALDASLDSRLKKKIFLIKKNKILKSLENESVFDSVAKISKNIGLDGNFNKETRTIELPANKKELKRLISFLNEDLYKSPISQIILEANSKRKFS